MFSLEGAAIKLKAIIYSKNSNKCAAMKVCMTLKATLFTRTSAGALGKSIAAGRQRSMLWVLGVRAQKVRKQGIVSVAVMFDEVAG